MTDNNASAPILVPIDFSLHSQEALVWAARLSEWMRAPLLVLHVVHDLDHAPGYYLRALAEAGLAQSSEQLVRLQEAAAELLHDTLVRVSSRHPTLHAPEQIPTMLVTGVPATRILEVANTANVQHIVMGSLGRTGLSHALLGSKAENVVRLASVPVTIVKAAPTHEQD